MRISGDSFPSKNTTNKSTDLLARLRTGDSVNAKLLNVSGNTLTLKLGDGTIFQAMTKSPLFANVGEFLEFNVSQIENQKIFLEVSQNGSSKQPSPDDLQKLLDSIGLKNTKENQQIIKAMTEQKIPINIENFNKLSLSSKELKTDFIKSAFLFANKLPIDEKSIHQLTSFLENKYMISGKLNTLQSSLNQSLSTLNTSQIQDKLSSMQANNLQSLLQNGLDIPDKNLANAIIKFMEGSPTNLKELINFANNLLNQIKAGEFKTSPLLLKFAQNLDSLLKTISNSSDDPKEFINNIFTKISESLKPTDLNVPTKYSDISNRLAALKEALRSGNISNFESLLSQINDLDENLSFLKQINNNQTYVHIPINFQDKNTSCELYIMKKEKNRKKIDPENATMFLSLDTENMGQVETLVQIEKKNISLNMRLENKEVINHFKNHFSELYNLISQTGYQIANIKYKIIENELTLINAEKELEKEFKKVTGYVDYKI